MDRMKEARRMPGSEWIKDRPRRLEQLYLVTRLLFALIYPLARRLAPRAAQGAVIRAEEIGKGYLFNCQMCGQCILHSTGMTCPMNCPKNLRNGPCGGVRPDGRCEVIPEMPCVWMQAWRRDAKMVHFSGDILRLQPPLDRRLQDTSSWINMAEEIDSRTQPGWQPIEFIDRSSPGRQ